MKKDPLQHKKNNHTEHGNSHVNKLSYKAHYTFEDEYQCKYKFQGHFARETYWKLFGKSQ